MATTTVPGNDNYNNNNGVVVVVIVVVIVVRQVRIYKCRQIWYYVPMLWLWWKWLLINDCF